MHTQLLNIGFVKRPDGSYYNHELCICVHIISDTQIQVIATATTKTGTTTIRELEDAILGGIFEEV